MIHRVHRVKDRSQSHTYCQGLPLKLLYLNLFLLPALPLAGSEVSGHCLCLLSTMFLIFLACQFSLPVSGSSHFLLLIPDPVFWWVLLHSSHHHTNHSCSASVSYSSHTTVRSFQTQDSSAYTMNFRDGGGRVGNIYLYMPK